MRPVSLTRLAIVAVAASLALPLAAGDPLRAQIGPGLGGKTPPAIGDLPHGTPMSGNGKPSPQPLSVADAPGAGKGTDTGAPAPAGPPAKPAEPSPPAKPAKAADFPPIVFFVAQGEPGACGGHCAEWIAADGAFDAGAPQRLRALLHRLGRRNLPIYFHSPGGSVAGALALGRLMRERGVTARVGTTVPQGCDPKDTRASACDKLKRSGRELPARLDDAHAMCNSACVYALAGAAVREVAPGVSLGVHSSSFNFIDRSAQAAARLSPVLLRATVAESYARIARYLTEMGVDPALLTAARQIANDHVRFLSRAEIWRFNIDRRTFVESDWIKVEEPTRAIRKVFVADAKGSHDFRTVLIHLSCAKPDRLRIDVAREFVAGDDAGASAISLAAGGSSRLIKSGRRATLPSSRMEFNIGTIAVPADFFLKAGDSIAVSSASDPASAPATSASEPAITLSTVGLGPALAELLPACGIAVAKPQLVAPASATSQTDIGK